MTSTADAILKKVPHGTRQSRQGPDLQLTVLLLSGVLIGRTGLFDQFNYFTS